MFAAFETKNVPIPGEIGENLGKKRRGRYVIQLKALFSKTNEELDVDVNNMLWPHHNPK
jgi:hypothetical protein